MAKSKKLAGKASSGATSNPSVFPATVGGLAVAVVAVLYYAFVIRTDEQTSNRPQPAQQDSAAEPSTDNLPNGLLPSAAQDLLTDFSTAHNESLLWGTYRPNVLFGVKSRTHPHSLAAGKAF